MVEILNQKDKGEEVDQNARLTLEIEESREYKKHKLHLSIVKGSKVEIDAA